jgi:predicted Zn finger-like uncharacterized protein
VNVTCPECSSVFRVDPAKVPAAGVRARCSVCSGIIAVPAPGGAAGAARPAAPAQTPYQPAPPVGDAARSSARTGEFSLSGAMPWSGSGEGRDERAVSVTSGPAPAEQVKGPGPVSVTPAASHSGRRPINPFLNKDPNLRAKRLARALVSDIITYQPGKHAEGLRDGTIRELFKDEIRKSYEEYTAQVGQQLAESTPYFQEALNEVLGGGRKIF